jgi:large subunit ribosomal protein L10
MALNLQNKKAIVEEISNIANNAISLVMADYSGLSAADITKLRYLARKADADNGIELRVVRNTLAERAFKGSPCECLNDYLVGPTLFGFSKNAPGIVAKLFKEFAKDNPKLVVKGLAVAGQYYDAKQLDVVASLPSREGAFQQLACMLITPVTTLARMMKEPATSMARAVQAAGEQKEA